MPADTNNNTNPSDLYTEREYWESYYKTQSADVARINKIVGEYDSFWKLLVDSCNSKPKTIIEIGAYPGRFLAYLSKKYNLIPTALDYNSDKTKIEECFKAFGIEKYEIIQADFLNHDSKEKYDLVISNGFAEHFENYDYILDQHTEYLAPGGAMLIMIPNKRYLRKYYSYLVDYNNLKIHNLKIMRLDVFRKFAERNQLKIHHLGYYGGFNFNVHQKLNIFQKFIHQTIRLVFKKLNPIISKKTSKYYSSTIISIFGKQ